MLNRAEALAHRKLDVFRRDVVLEINKSLYPALVLGRRQRVHNFACTIAPFARTGAHAAYIFVGLVGNIGTKVIAPLQASLAVRPQMHTWRPASGHQQCIANDAADCLIGITAYLDRFNTVPAVYGDDTVV